MGTTWPFIVLLVLILYVWWSLRSRIAELEGGGGSTAAPPCCDEQEKRIDDIVKWLKGQYRFNKAIDNAICSLEKMAVAKNWDAWDKNDSNCGNDLGGGRTPPPEPDPGF